MAHRRTSSSGEARDIVKFCSFWGLILAGIAGAISFTIWFFGRLGISIGLFAQAKEICELLSQIGLLVGTALAAWMYVRNKSKGYKILYFVVLILCLVGLISIF